MLTPGNSHIFICTEEPQVTLDVAGKRKSTFWLILGPLTLFLILTLELSPLNQLRQQGSKETLCPISIHFLSLVNLKAKYSNSFLIVSQCPIPLLGWDLLAQMGTILLFPEESLELSKVMIISRSQNQEEIPSLVLDTVNLLVPESGIPGRVKAV